MASRLLFVGIGDVFLVKELLALINDKLAVILTKIAYMCPVRRRTCDVGEPLVCDLLAHQTGQIKLIEIEMSLTP
jgi:hypothetical protein